MLWALLVVPTLGYHELLQNDTWDFHCYSYEKNPQTWSECLSFGDARVVTFDGTPYTFSGSVGDYFLVSPSTSSGMTVAVRQRKCSWVSPAACSTAFSIRYDTTTVAIEYPASGALKLKYQTSSGGSWQTFAQQTLTLSNFGTISSSGVENQGFKIDIALISGQTASFIWLSSSSGLATIYSGDLGSQGLCGAFDGCWYNDMTLDSDPDTVAWRDWSMSEEINKTIYLATPVLNDSRGEDVVYAGPDIAYQTPIVPVQGGPATLKLFVDSWRLSEDEVLSYFGAIYDSLDPIEAIKESSTSDAPTATPAADPLCFPGFFLAGVEAPPFLAAACAAEGTSVQTPTVGAHYVLLQLCDAYCQAGSFPIPWSELVPDHCARVCKPSPVAFELDSEVYNETNVPYELDVERTAVFRPLALGGHYVLELKAADECEVLESQIVVDITCVDPPSNGGTNLDAGSNKTVFRSWFGFPEVHMDGVAAQTILQMQWRFVVWPGTTAPTIDREYSQYAVWKPLMIGLHTLELSGYDGCSVYRSQVNVTVECNAPASVKINGTQRSIWGVGGFPALTLDYDLTHYGLGEDSLSVPLVWSLVFPSSGNSSAGATVALNSYTDLAVGGIYTAGNRLTQYTSFDETAAGGLGVKTYTLYLYDTTPFTTPINSSSGTTIDSMTNSSDFDDAKPNEPRWMNRMGRTVQTQMRNTSQTFSFTAALRPVCTITMTGVRGGAVAVTWAPIATSASGVYNTNGQSCIGFYRIQLSTDFTKEAASSSCAVIGDQVTVEVTCGAPPVVVPGPAVSVVRFNYTSRAWVPVSLDFSTQYDPLNRGIPLVSQAQLVTVPPLSTATSNIALSPSQVASFTPDAGGAYVLQYDLSNGCSAFGQQVTTSALCSEANHILANFSATTFVTSTPYSANPIIFDLNNRQSGSSESNPKPPVTVSITMIGTLPPPEISSNFPAASLTSIGPDQWQVNLGIGGVYIVAAGFKTCNVQYSQSTTLTITSLFEVNGYKCFSDLASRVQNVVWNETGFFPTFDMSPYAVAGAVRYTWKFMKRPAETTIPDSFAPSTAPVDVDFTPDVAGTYILRMVVTDNNLGWCTDNITLNAVCQTTTVTVSNSGTLSNSSFVLYWSESTESNVERVSEWNWTSASDDVAVGFTGNLTSALIDLPGPGEYTFTLYYRYDCTPAGTYLTKTVAVFVPCPVPSISTLVFSDRQGTALTTPPVSTWDGWGFPRVYFKYQTNELAVGTTTSWFVVSAPHGSVYDPSTVLLNTTTPVVTSTSILTPGSTAGSSILGLTVSTTWTTIQKFVNVLLPTGLPQDPSFVDPDVAGTYTVAMTIGDLCRSPSRLSTLTFTVACGLPPVPAVAITALSSTPNPMGPIDEYTLNNTVVWLQSPATAPLQKVSVIAFFDGSQASGYLKGKIIFRQRNSSLSTTGIYIDLANTRPGDNWTTPRAFGLSFVTQCGSSGMSVWDTNSDSSTSKCSPTQPQFCQSGNITSRIGQLTVANGSIPFPVFTDTYLNLNTAVTTGVTLYMKDFNGTSFCVPLRLASSYTVNLARGFGRKVYLDGSSSHTGATVATNPATLSPHQSSLTYSWMWSFLPSNTSSRVQGINRKIDAYNNVLGTHTTDDLSQILGTTISGPTDRITNFLFTTRGFYLFQLTVNDGCTSSSSLVVVEADCTQPLATTTTADYPLLSINSPTVIRNFNVNSEDITQLSFDALASTGITQDLPTLLTANPAVISWSLVTFSETIPIGDSPISAASARSLIFVFSTAFAILVLL